MYHLYAASVPFWYLAVRKVKQVLTNRTVPVLALLAAFSFVLMMFNVPLPGGTTGHAVGGTLLAIILGPWAGRAARVRQAIVRKNAEKHRV